MVGLWLGEFCYFCYLTVLPCLAFVLLNKIYEPFFFNPFVKESSQKHGLGIPPICGTMIPSFHPKLTTALADRHGRSGKRS